ncbi:MAG: hypothetical protein P5702_23810 [Limnospira sp. PMC 1291.21]|nr:MULTISPECIES: hypothetical protein [unclassified Limnospira]MDT9231650.1 hypothetical protein [Limnospira sp. PMC 1242.20]MDT9246895.1 hypothetical protein [Limnospira sp. PMC 1249.20]MDT9206166.1 hypothetical protein [Limnospira sp. PMC 1243.20]MDT9211316.1 hypothetical protein [Limnospira sp. PMC 1252.20]MDT9216423.1 hypothetical protein [Limnospira sp. PMC 1256.20]
MFTLVLLSGIWEMWSVYQFESRPTNIEREAAKWLRNMEREREREPKDLGRNTGKGRKRNELVFKSSLPQKWKAIAFRVEYLVPCLVVTRRRSCFEKTIAYSEKWATVY